MRIFNRRENSLPCSGRTLTLNEAERRVKKKRYGVGIFTPQFRDINSVVGVTLTGCGEACISDAAYRATLRRPVK